MKNLIRIGFIILVSIHAFSCMKEIAPTEVSGLTINKSSILLDVESKDTLKISIEPSNATNKDIVWSSSNSSIVTVNSSGEVIALAPGKAIITVTTADGSKTETCVVSSIKWTMHKSNYGQFNKAIHGIAADAQDNIWCGGYSLLKFDGTSWTSYLPYQGVGYVAIDKQGNKWFGTNGYGIFKFDGTNWTTYTTSNSNLTDNSVTAMAVDAQGGIWIGTSSRITWRGTGVSKFDGNTWIAYTAENTNNGLAYDNVTSITIDAQGNKWFITGKGISKFDGTNWTTYTSGNTNNELIDFVDCVAIDAQGNKWFGTTKGDILKFDGINWTTISNKVSGLGAITTIAIDALGNKWIGTDSGITKFDGTEWTKYNRYKNGLIYYYVTSITFDSKGIKWIGTSDGVFELHD